MRPRRRWRALLIAAVVAVPIALKTGDVLIGQNFHTVEAGAVYRSAQLGGEALERRVRTMGIKSVLNLRGRNTGRDWYDDEVESSRLAGVRHYDIALSARKLPPPAQLADLVTVLREAPRPLLIHCRNGADRSGLASAIALMLDEGVTPGVASSRQLNLWYGHMPIGKATAMDRVLALYAGDAKDKGFAAWVREDYPALYRRERGADAP